MDAAVRAFPSGLPFRTIVTFWTIAVDAGDDGLWTISVPFIILNTILTDEVKFSRQSQSAIICFTMIAGAHY